MSIATSLSLGFSLSMDAFAASVAHGSRYRRGRMLQALRTALYFSVFEAVFPVLGWALGLALGSLMARVDHWVAFTLLLGIGLKMIHDARHPRPRADSGAIDSMPRLMLLALSTSIDAAAVGVTLVVLKISIVEAALVIGATTFAMTCTGFLIGGLAGSKIPRYAEALGGVLLIAIGSRILIEHTLLS